MMTAPAADFNEKPTPFELYALRYATHTGRTAKDNFLYADPHESGENLDYFIWLARRDDEIYVIDTGFGQQAADGRGRTLLRRPVDALALMDVDARQVSEVILTHLHYDHAGTLGDFPSARFHLQVDEAGHATGPCMCDPKARAPFDVDNIVAYIRNLYAGRIEFHRGDKELAPGIWLHSVPGHSAGLQAVRVYTKRGWVVLASDATHFYANMDRQKPFPVFDSVEGVLEGVETMHRLAGPGGLIVPGHDPDVLRRFAKSRPGTDDIVLLTEPLS